MTSLKREEWQPQGIDDFECSAWDALGEVDSSVLVTAGAGAGKTEFLAQKAAYLLQTGVCPAPRRVLAISFKKDAAQNLAERVSLRCSVEQAWRFDSMTFDAFTKSLIDRFRRSIPGQWMPPRGYRIITSYGPEFNDFCNRHGLQKNGRKQFEKALALEMLPFQSGSTSQVVKFWEENYRDNGEVMLSFSMINRLVHFMLRENQHIRSALRKTYPFVFLDEFQDTTYAQFDFLKLAFHGSRAKLTAVGDDKQRIMGWAGAMPDAFERFQQDYGARKVSLLSNWRSHKQLVATQHVIAQQLDRRVELPRARNKKHVDGDVAAIWDFPNAQTESKILAKWIAAEVKSGTVKPHEIAVLVRMHVHKVEQNLLPAFSAQNVRLRNLARELGEVSIQDILSEELTRLLIPLLRLGATAKSPSDWDMCQRNLDFLNANDPHDYVAYRKSQSKLQTQVRLMRREMCEHPLHPDTAKVIAIKARDFWDNDRIRQAFPAYSRQRDFDRAWNGFVALLVECADIHDNWTDVLDEFEGFGQVPLMTVHKSKGLEFHTMIFYGLDDRTWWSLTPGNEEDLNVFFVALTRAEQRAFFTLCRERGSAIKWLEALLQPTGVRHRDGATLI